MESWSLETLHLCCGQWRVRSTAVVWQMLVVRSHLACLFRENSRFPAASCKLKPHQLAAAVPCCSAFFHRICLWVENHWSATFNLIFFLFRLWCACSHWDGDGVVCVHIFGLFPGWEEHTLCTFVRVLLNCSKQIINVTHKQKSVLFRFWMIQSEKADCWNWTLYKKQQQQKQLGRLLCI